MYTLLISFYILYPHVISDYSVYEVSTPALPPFLQKKWPKGSAMVVSYLVVYPAPLLARIKWRPEVGLGTRLQQWTVVSLGTGSAMVVSYLVAYPAPLLARIKWRPEVGLGTRLQQWTVVSLGTGQAN